MKAGPPPFETIPVLNGAECDSVQPTKAPAPDLLEPPEKAPECGLFAGLLGHLGSAWAGAKLLQGGAATEVLAKKAALDAVCFDEELVQQAQAVSSTFQESVAKLRAAQAKEKALGNMQRAAELARLVLAHEERARAYDVVLKALQGHVAAPDMSAPEWNALRMAQMGSCCQETTEAAMAQIFGESKDSTGRRRKTACGGICVSL
jgi:hypothetical protein